MSRPFLRSFVSATLLSLLASPVLAHAALVSATPGPGDEIEPSPAELVATFNQNLDPSRTSLEVRDASGVTVARGGELGDGPREFRLRLPELEPGEYEVRWTSFSAEDGELARDSYAFTVVAAPSSSPSPTPSSPSSPTPSSPTPSSPTPSSPPPTSPTPTTASPSPVSSGTPAPDDTTAGDDAVILIPILAAFVIVGAIGGWLIRRRTT